MFKGERPQPQPEISKEEKYQRTKTRLHATGFISYELKTDSHNETKETVNNITPIEVDATDYRAQITREPIVYKNPNPRFKESVEEHLVFFIGLNDKWEPITLKDPNTGETLFFNSSLYNARFPGESGEEQEEELGEEQDGITTIFVPRVNDDGKIEDVIALKEKFAVVPLDPVK